MPPNYIRHALSMTKAQISSASTPARWPLASSWTRWATSGGAWLASLASP